MKVRVYITQKKGVLDPQEKAIKQVLTENNMSKITKVKRGKFFDLDLDVNDLEELNLIVDKACKELLVNSITEEYSFELLQ